MSILSKHLLNSPATLVVDALTGLCAVNPQLALDIPNKIVYLRDHDRSKVTLMCGGGSGHEPAHAGFVGEGILTAAVCGSVFASPNASQVRRGIDLISSNKGTVIIVKNYTGDVLNFGLAKEQHAALHPEQAESLKFVIVGDDVAVGRSQGKIVGRRGLAGTVLVYKIAGALAQRGGSLDEVYSIATWAANRLATVGVSLGHTHVPGTAPLTADLSFDEIEIGMGIHNESGHRRLSPVPTLSVVISQLLDLLTSKDADRNFVAFAEKENNVVVLVNNLGSISDLELSGVVGEVRKQLESRGFNISRLLSGTFMTSLNMPGFSVTLLLLPGEHEHDAPESKLVLSLLDDKAETPGWPWSAAQAPLPVQEQLMKGDKVEISQPSSRKVTVKDPAAFIKSIRRAAEALIKAEPEITNMDLVAGDGDCGLTLKAGAEGVLSKLDSQEISGDDVVRSIIAIAQVAEEAMGGTSGALYSIFCSGLAQGLQATLPDGGSVTPQEWASALKAALDKLYSYTRARPPSRTLVDPLAAFINTFISSNNHYDDAKAAADKAAEDTKNLRAKAGRSAYVEGDRLINEQIPDPGAWGVKIIVDNLTG